MNFIKRFLIKTFKKKGDSEPWLSYYSKEDRSIKFTNKTIYEYLKESVGNDTDYYALNYFNKRITYGEFFQKIETAGRALRSLGVKPGDVVTICMPNTPEGVIMFYAANSVGAIADMIHPLSAPNDIKNSLLESKSRILLLVDIDYEKMRDLIPDTYVYKTIVASVSISMPSMLTIGYEITRGIKIKKPKIMDKDYISWSDFMLKGISYNKPFKNSMKAKDTALILHSGGTTGVPKGIMISNYSFNALAQQGGVNVIDAKPKDKVVTILPIFHGFGLGVVTHCPLCLKVEVILVPEFDGKKFPNLIKKTKPNIIAGVPTLWNAMLDNPRFDGVDLSDLKYVISGGDYLTLSMENKMNNFLHTHGANISMCKGYGMTEVVAAVLFTHDGVNEPGSVGIPMVGNTIKICKPGTTEELPYGEEGEICISGPTLMQGYWNNPEETKKVLIKHGDGNTYMHSGDMGYMSGGGVVYFTGRLKRMIVSSGFNIYPSEIEEVIERHPNVLKCCVIGVPHPYKVQVAKAFIMLKNKVKDTDKITKEIKALCKENLALYSQPKYFEYRDELPKTLYNKIDFIKLEREEKNKEK